MKLSNSEIFNEIENDYVASIENIEDISDLNSFYMNELRKENIDIEGGKHHEKGINGNRIYLRPQRVHERVRS